MKYPNTLGRIEAVWNKLGGEAGVDRFLCGELNVVATDTNRLLEFSESVPFPTIKSFSFDDHFKDSETVDGVRVSLGDNFKKRFAGKVEKDVAGCNIRVHKLLRLSCDLPIRYEIGEDNEETQLAHLFHFLKLQGNKSCWFIFYIRDAEGILWAVGVYWCGDGWYVGADSVEGRGRWDVDSFVCSR